MIAPLEAEDPSCLMLDSCEVLNLYATRRFEEIARSIGRPVAVTEYTRAREALWVGSGRQSDPRSDHERVDLQPLIERGTLLLTDIVGESEADLFVELASTLDDGEAIAGAIAISRSMQLGTDDRRAKSVFAARVPPLVTVTTSELIRTWAHATGAESSTVAEVLRLIQTRARFTPGPGDPLADWWKGFAASEVPEESPR